MHSLRRKDSQVAAPKAAAADAKAADASAVSADAPVATAPPPSGMLSELPPPPNFCSACNDIAVLSYKCMGCQLVNYYCNKYSCQTDHWTKHLDDCEELLDKQQDETVITRLKDGTSWSRKRRRNIKRDVDLELQLERLPVLDIQLKQIVGTTLEGWLAHPGDANRQWHLRYFVLKDDILFCFSNEESTARGAISLLGFKVRTAEEDLKEKCGIKVYHADGRTHYFVASDKDEAAKWVKALSKAASPRWGVTIQRGQSAGDLGSSHGSLGGSFSNLHEDDQVAKGVVAQPDVRSILLRADVNDPSKGDKLVNVRLTFYLSEPATEGLSYDTLSRQNAVARVLSMPPPYNRDHIRQEATEMGDADGFAKKSRWFFSTSRKKSVRGLGSLGSSMPQLHRGGSVSSIRSVEGGGDVSPKSFARASLFDLHSGERPASLDESRGRNSSASSLEQPGGSPRLRDGSPTSTLHHGSQPSLAALHVRSASRAAPAPDWGGVAPPAGALNMGRRRSIVTMDPASGSAVAAAAAAAAAAQFQQQLMHHQSLLHGRGGDGGSGSESSSIDLSHQHSDAASFDMNAMFKEGWLMRVDGPEPTRLWFVLDDFYLSAFPTDDSTTCLLEIDLEGCEYMPEGEDGFIVRQGNNMLHARAADGIERDRWLRVMDAMRDYFVDEAARGAVGASAADGSTQAAPQAGSVPPTPRAPKSATDEDDEDEEAGDDEGFSLAQAVSAQSPRTIRGHTPAPDTAGDDAVSERKRGEDEFNEALERAAADLQQSQLSTPMEESPAAVVSLASPLSPRPAAEGAAEPSPVLLPPSVAHLPPLPKYTHPLETPAEIKAAQAEAAKRKMSYLFPPKSKPVDLVKGAVAPPTDGKVLDVEEMKKFAVHDGIDKEEEEKAAPGTVMLAQDSDDVIVQFHVDGGGKVDEYNITAGTLDVLIARLADENHPDTVYIDMFLLSYRHVISSSALMDRLFARFNVHPPPCATPEQLAYYNQWASVIQVRAIGVIKKWIDNYWGDFVADPAALECLMEFLDFTERSSTLMAGLVDRLRRIVAEKQEATRAAEVFNSVKETPKPLKMDFTQFEPREFARQMALADHALFVAIAPVEFVIRLWEGNGPQTRNLTEMIDWFNRISFFTATTIVVQPILKKRAQIVENFIKVLKESYRIHNFNGMMAILSGLNNASVRRLKKTWALVGAKHIETLRQMEELMASAFNYRSYRTLLSQIDKEPRPGPLVPFMGLFLRDLTFLNDGNPKKFKGNLVNMGKLRMVAQRILRLQVYQMSRYSFPTTRASSTIKEFLKAPYAMTDENALYACSLQCEPREAK